MPMEIITLSQLSDLELTPSDRVITVNQRLARRCLEAHNQLQSQKGLQAWHTPPILPLNTWLTQLAIEHHCALILSTHQSHHLWCQLIRNSDAGGTLLNITQTARQAESAWQTLHLWGVDLSDIDAQDNTDIKQFLSWATSFQVLCQENQWITPAELPAILLKRLTNESWCQEKTLYWVGFDDHPPCIQSLMDKLAQNHILKTIDIECESQDIARITAHDQKTEIIMMATWAKKIIEQTPTAKVGCIIPNLNESRRILFNTFTQIFHPNTTIPGQYVTEKMFNITAGIPLAQTPLVKTALNWLSWLGHPQPISSLAWLLQSPYLHQAPIEREAGAQLDMHLRTLSAETPFYRLFEAFQQCPYTYPEDSNIVPWVQRCQSVFQQFKHQPETNTLLHWQQHIKSLLTLSGWPGQRTLNSEEYQQYMRWQVMLDELLSFEVILPRLITWQTAWRCCCDLANQTIFQAEGSHAPIQIMGTLEASGNTFDYLWVMELDDATWPAPAAPNPFIPYDLQQALAMPHATAERERAFTTRLMHRLTHGAPVVRLSYAMTAGDMPQTPSYFIQHYPEATLPTVMPKQSLITPLLADIPDQPIPMQSNETPRGGAWLLKLQSTCPFKAFATTRLNAIEPPQPSTGLDFKTRGIITHDVLERLWRDLKTQAALAALSDDTRQRLIQSTIQTAIKPYYPDTTDSTTTLLLNTETIRLQALIEQWLLLELTRAPFEVTGVEQTQRLQISTLPITIRLDRIDTLETGERVVIDYKTGITNINAWFGDRLDDPQLPCYVYSDDNLQGMVFGEIRPELCQFKGIMMSTSLADLVPGTKSIETLTQEQISWASQRSNWQETLEQLARDYQAGIATVDPKQPTTCRYCDLQPLCRIEHT